MAAFLRVQPVWALYVLSQVSDARGVKAPPERATIGPISGGLEAPDRASPG